MNFNWADDTNCAVTVCDTEGVVIYQNKQSISVNGEYRGKSMLPCHNERSKGIIARILEKGDTNAYTIEKKGIRNDFHNEHSPHHQQGGKATFPFLFRQLSPFHKPMPPIPFTIFLVTFLPISLLLPSQLHAVPPL